MNQLDGNFLVSAPSKGVQGIRLTEIKASEGKRGTDDVSCRLFLVVFIASFKLR